MAIAQIKLTFKQLIDAKAQTDFERDIFDVSYNEFLLRAPVYNPDDKFCKFSEMFAAGTYASKLHGRISKVILPLLDGLKNMMPVLRDNIGRNVAYEKVAIELLESDLYSWSAHSLLIKYTTGNLILHKIIGEYLLLSVPAGLDSRTEEANTFMLKIKPDLAITSYQEYQNKMASDFTGFASN